MAGLPIMVRSSASLQRKIDTLRGLADGFDEAVVGLVKDSAMSVLARTKDKVPHSSGILEGSLIISYISRGFSAIIGSWVPYAAKQEYDKSLDHSQREARVRVLNTKSGKPGSIIKGTNQDNPNAQWGFLRKSLAEEKQNFLLGCKQIVAAFGEGWKIG